MTTGYLSSLKKQPPNDREGLFPLFKKLPDDTSENNDMPPPPPKRKSIIEPGKHNNTLVQDTGIKKKRKISKEEKLAIRVIRDKCRDGVIASLSEEFKREPTPEEINDVLDLIVKRSQENGLMQIMLDEYLELKLAEARGNAPIITNDTSQDTPIATANSTIATLSPGS